MRGGYGRPAFAAARDGRVSRYGRIRRSKFAADADDRAHGLGDLRLVVAVAVD